MKKPIPPEFRAIADVMLGLGKQFVAAGLESVATEARDRLDNFIDGVQKMQPPKPIEAETTGVGKAKRKRVRR